MLFNNYFIIIWIFLKDTKDQCKNVTFVSVFFLCTDENSCFGVVRLLTIDLISFLATKLSSLVPKAIIISSSFR